MPLHPLVEEVKALGHSGNPVRDLALLLRSLRGGLDVPWTPAIDESVAVRFVQRIRDVVDVPPTAGSRGEGGFELEGSDGVTLNALTSMAALEAALREGRAALSLKLTTVPAPEPIEMGTPDAVAYDDPEEEQGARRGPRRPTGGGGGPPSPPPRIPTAWLPSQGRECNIPPPYQRFCQGPRKVPKPHGEAAALAEELGLGTLKTVRRVSGSRPLDSWVRAAGGPVEYEDVLWPVAGGRLWRGFGQVPDRGGGTRLHKGVDIGAPTGTWIRAANDGIVGYADNKVRGFGNLLVLIHGDGSVTFHAHCDRILVFPGQRVKRNQVVAEVGTTGICRGAHLHFEYRTGGRLADPWDSFVGR
jgi:murein DD-endopeptidase MepM/ murein hydrolase activator NlpD